MKITEIKPNENNPRFIADAKFEKLKKSIESFPQMMALRPIVVDADNVILGGNMRFRALQDLGYKEIPDEWVKKADELTEEQKREFIIKDNSGFGSWDWDALANEWDTEQLSEWGLDMPDDWAGEDEQHLETKEDDYQEPDNMQVDVVLGDLIEIGEHRLLCGDSTDSDQVEKLMDGEKADMVFTDPPFDLPVSEFMHLVPLFQGVMQIWITNDKQCFELSLSNEDAFYTTFVLRTGNSMLKNNRQPITTHCMMPCFYFHEAYEDLKNVETIIDAGRDLYMAGKGMSHAKSIATYTSIFTYWTKANQVICDWFMHSGSTMVAAHQLNRKCYGMELDPKYCQVIIDRMHKLDPSLPIKINGKDYTPPKQDD
jgi:hypothetical protein